MTTELVLTIIGGAGFLAGFAQILQFLNSRKSTKAKGSADAYLAWRQFTSGAFEDRDREYARVESQRDIAWTVRDALIDLVQELITALRGLGADQVDLDTYQDRLDDARQR